METKAFIIKARQIHGNKYDYSKSVYKTARSKVCVICPDHGEFYIRPNCHISGKQGCKKCGIQQRPQNKPKLVESFILDCQKIHGNKYDYSIINYVRNNIKVEIICQTHGSFFQKPNAHLNGQGCPLCGYNHHRSITIIHLQRKYVKYAMPKNLCRSIMLIGYIIGEIVNLVRR